MRLAADLQRLANRAQETKDYDYAVKLHDRAITLRNLVRVRDLKNAECHCLIAGNYRSIGQIEKQRGNFDAAVISYQRALLIYEDLERLEPDRGWNKSVAATARDLAEVLGKRTEFTIGIDVRRDCSSKKSRLCRAPQRGLRDQDRLCEVA